MNPKIIFEELPKLKTEAEVSVMRYVSKLLKDRGIEHQVEYCKLGLVVFNTGNSSLAICGLTRKIVIKGENINQSLIEVAKELSKMSGYSLEVRK